MTPTKMAEMVEVIIEDDRWARVGLDALASVACTATLAHIGLEPSDFGISLLGCNDERIATLNAKFRNQPTATNILSWPSENRTPAGSGGFASKAACQDQSLPQELGDMAIAFETCDREGRAAGKTLSDHITHLLVHGTLHLLGYDHTGDKDATIMERLEAQVLATLGIEDPYRDN
ncbi:MAG: rRNA maturation RNase YbeY [Paracoccaceae bacterium]